MRSWVNSANLATAAATHSSRPDGRNTTAERTPNRSVRELPVVDPRGENAGGFATIGRQRCSRKREGRDGRPIGRGRTDCEVGALRRPGRATQEPGFYQRGGRRGTRENRLRGRPRLGGRLR